MMDKASTLTRAKQTERTQQSSSEVDRRRFEAPRLEVVALPAITAGTHTWKTAS